MDKMYTLHRKAKVGQPSVDHNFLLCNHLRQGHKARRQPGQNEKRPIMSKGVQLAMWSPFGPFTLERPKDRPEDFQQMLQAAMAGAGDGLDFEVGEVELQLVQGLVVDGQVHLVGTNDLFFLGQERAEGFEFFADCESLFDCSNGK